MSFIILLISIAKLYRNTLTEVYIIMANKLVNFQLPEELIKKFKEVADKNCLSMSAQLRILILKFLDEYKEK